VKVPLVIWNPALFKGAGRSQRISSHIDIGPTVLDLLGVDYPGDWQGRSYFAPMADSGRRAYFYGAKDDYVFGVRDGGFKYILNATLGRDELYDLKQDPDEKRNLAKDRPEQARALRRRLAAWTQYQR
jgi:arylsulfatase A-like enzyme